ncbi:MAG: TolC family outer membrane protein [Pseudomonadota bacterium]
MRARQAAYRSVRTIGASWLKFVLVCSPLTVVVLAALPAEASAESLKQALRAAYRNNPQLDAERARLRATDEEVPRARSGWRPVISGQVEFGARRNKTKPRSAGDGAVGGSSYGLSLSQPVFTGFRTLNAVREAEANIRAGRANLRNVEAQILLEAVTAYAGVVRDRALVRLNRGNVRVLGNELRAARARRAAGEVTVTDVAQARARLARAKSGLDQAKADLKSSNAEFLRVIGHKPRNLRTTGFQKGLTPNRLRAAYKIAMDESPVIISALYREQSARHNVDKLRGELLPSVSVEANVQTTTGVSRITDEQTSASVMGRVTVPIYQGGETRARVRQAKHSHVSRLQEVEQTRDLVRARLTSAWSQLRAARGNLASDQEQVRAAQIALEGVREEEQVGQRTILDVLNAEQELLEANTSRVRTIRDVVVSQYTLLAAMGRLDASFLHLKTDIYEPKAHYMDARRKAFSTSIAQPRPTFDTEETSFEHAIESAIVTGAVDARPHPVARQRQLTRRQVNARRNQRAGPVEKPRPTVRQPRISLRGVNQRYAIHRKGHGERETMLPQPRSPRSSAEGAIPALRNSVIER